MNRLIKKITKRKTIILYSNKRQALSYRDIYTYEYDINIWKKKFKRLYTRNFVFVLIKNVFSLNIFNFDAVKNNWKEGFCC